MVLKGYFESRELFWMRKLDAKRLMDIEKFLSVQVGVVFFVIPLLMIEKAQNKKQNLVCKAEVIRILDRYFFHLHEVLT